ncbi:MAG: M28 family peptidase, partial [Leeuwenhoekiella sp.]
MIKIIVCGLLLSLTACGTGNIKTVDAEKAAQNTQNSTLKADNYTTPSASTSTSATTKADKDVKQIVKPDDVKKHLEFLASDDLQGRATGSEGIEKAAAYIIKQFQSAGIKPYFTSYRDKFDAKGKDGYNIVGMIEGTDPQLKDEFVIVGAHYDHIGIIKTVAGDSIANGANDDASGTTAVLELAKYFAKAKNNKRSLIFTLYAGEELGLLGSRHLAQRLKDDGLNLYTMFNIEMIGVPMQNRDYLVYLTGYDNSNMAEKFKEYTGKNVMGF